MCERVQYVADSPYDWLNILEWLKSELRESISTCKEIKLVFRCSDCFRKIKKINLTFSDDFIQIKTWDSNCHLNSPPVENEYRVSPFTKDRLFIDAKKNKPDYFRIEMNYSSGIDLIIPLSPWYVNEDYVVHGQKVYKDRQLACKVRKNNNYVVYLLEDFIDMKGLVPYYSTTICVTF